MLAAAVAAGLSACLVVAGSGVASAVEGGPVAHDDHAVTAMGTAVTIPVLANDEDPDGGPLTVTSVTDPGHGSATIQGSTVRYTPVADYTGGDSFRYTATDGAGRSAVAEVTVEVDATPPSVPIRVHTRSRWHVLTDEKVAGRATPGARVAITVTGPGFRKTYRTDATADSGHYRIEVRVKRPGKYTVTSVSEDSTAATTATAQARYESRISGPLHARDVRYTWRRGCPVGPRSLRRVSVRYWNWHGAVHTGDLIVNARFAGEVAAVFKVAFRTHFPIRRITPADAYYREGRVSSARSDILAMRADNTSAFNCRAVTGSRGSRVSHHSYGVALDINTRENPYLTRGRFYPKSGRKYLNRSHHRKGMLLPRTPMVRAMKARGWLWGTRFAHPDYQHWDMR
jgi:hypothetical protein